MYVDTYTFSFTLKLRTAVLQKLGIFYMWNARQKDDGMDQNILQCCYAGYVTTYQQA